MHNGYIRLHRKILDNPLFKKSTYFHLWSCLLLLANHTPNKIMWNGDIIVINEGQLVTGRKELSIKTGIPESTIEDILKFLEKQHQIRQQKTTKFRLITVINWKQYQNSDSKSDNKATTKQQQADTNNNDKNDKNENNILSTNVDEPTAPAEIEYIPEERSNSTENKQVMGIMLAFRRINPTLKINHRTHRTAIKEMIKMFGYDKLKKYAQYAISVQGQKYAPTITTPYLLQQKIAELKIYYDKNSNSQILSI